MSRRALLIVAALVLAAGAAWYVAAPWLTLQQMRAAAQADDADALSAHVDYPALREDLKAEVMAQVMAEAQKDKSGGGALGMAIGAAMVGPMIDGFVTPAGLKAAFAANRKKRAAGASMPAGNAFDVGEDVEIERRSFDEFVVGKPSGKDARMVFRRHGLGWKLSGVDIPNL